MVTQEIKGLIALAILEPGKYSKGAEKEKLRAAFDMMASQLCLDLFGTQISGRLAMRQRLNSCNQADFDAASWTIIVRLNAALRASETSLFRKDYSDGGDRSEKFISEELAALMEVLP